MGKSKDLATGAAYQDQTESDTRYVNTAGDSMTGELLVRRARSNTAGDAALTIHPSDTTVSYGMRIDQNTNSLNFDQVNNNTTKMSIDTSGRVTMPNQPSMSGRAIRPISTSGYVSLNVNLYLDDLQHNIGNHWNNSTGVWTCPVAGRYWVFVSILMDDNTSSAELARYEIKKNGSEFFRGYDQSYNSGSTYGGMIASGGIFNCSANDTITIVGTHGKLHAGAESNFTICLLS